MPHSKTYYYEEFLSYDELIIQLVHDELFSTMSFEYLCNLLYKSRF
jgi:hypothetical protein